MFASICGHGAAGFRNSEDNPFDRFRTSGSSASFVPFLWACAAGAAAILQRVSSAPLDLALMDFQAEHFQMLVRRSKLAMRIMKLQPLEGRHGIVMLPGTLLELTRLDYDVKVFSTYRFLRLVQHEVAEHVRASPATRLSLCPEATLLGPRRGVRHAVPPGP